MSEQTPLLSGSSSSIPSDSDNLAKFRHAIGINASPLSTNGINDIEAARKKPLGLYAEVIRIRRMREIQFHVVDILYYTVVIAQILIGAILASLGSLAKIHPTAITILGVVNASIAGILALLKGQGLPDRIRKDEFQMKRVQDFIESEDIRMALQNDITAQELEQTVQNIFDAYNRARDTAEMNRPSSYAVQVDKSNGSKPTANTDAGGPAKDIINRGKAKYTVS
jgi:hypothetical protein